MHPFTISHRCRHGCDHARGLEAGPTRWLHGADESAAGTAPRRNESTITNRAVVITAAVLHLRRARFQAMLIALGARRSRGTGPLNQGTGDKRISQPEKSLGTGLALSDVRAL